MSSGFNWKDATIYLEMEDVKHDEVAIGRANTIPANDRISLSFVHEYVHFLQFSCSLIGLRILTGLLLCAAELKTAANLSDDDTEVPWARNYAKTNFDDLSAQFDCQFVKQGKALLQYLPSAYEPFDIRTDFVSPSASSDGKLYGFTLPGNRFLPFTIGVIADWCARSVDQRYAKSECINDIPISSDPADEQIQYRLLYEAVGSGKYGNVPHDRCDTVVILLCTLAIMSPVPDEALAVMLRGLSSLMCDDDLTSLPTRLIELLHEDNLLALHYFDATISEADLPGCKQYLPVLEAFKRRAQYLLRDPEMLVNAPLNRDSIIELMKRFGVPRVCGYQSKKEFHLSFPRIGPVNCESSLGLTLERALKDFRTVRSHVHAKNKGHI